MIRLTAALGPHTPVSTGSSGALAAQLGPVTVTLTILDATGSAYQVAAGTLVADGLPHLLVGSLGGNQARYPLRVAAITATYRCPCAPHHHWRSPSAACRWQAGRATPARLPWMTSRRARAAAAERAARPRVSAHDEPGGDVRL